MSSGQDAALRCANGVRGPHSRLVRQFEKLERGPLGMKKVLVAGVAVILPGSMARDAGGNVRRSGEERQDRTEGT